MTDRMIARKGDGFGWMIFNNPERHNAVSLDMWQAAIGIMEDFAADDEVRVIVIAGAGEKSFVSGADISKFDDERAAADAVIALQRRDRRGLSGRADQPQAHHRDDPGLLHRRRRQPRRLLPTCGSRASGRASPFPRRSSALGYDYPRVRRVMDLVGPAFAKEIFFTARQFAADEALAMGLVNRVVPHEELEAATTETAGRIAGNAPLTMKAIKQAVHEALKDESGRDLALCERLVAECFASDDYAEGRRAFAEKRKPVFKGR